MPSIGKNLFELKLSPGLTEILTLLERHGDLDDIMEASPEPDSEIVRRLSELLHLGLIEGDPQ